MDERNDNYVRTPEEDYQDNWADLFIGGNENEASEEEHLITGQSISQHHKHNILKTAHLTFLSFGLSAASSIKTPTIQELRCLVGTTYEGIGRALAGKSVGILIGGTVIAALTDKYINYVNAIMTVTLMMVGVSTFLIPLAPDILWMWIINAIQGFFVSGTNTVSIVVCNILWREKSVKMFHLLQIGHGLGRVFAVGIGKLFIMRQRDDILHSHITEIDYAHYINQTNIGQYTTSNATTVTCARGSKIVIAFAICGGISAILSVLAFVFHILDLSSSDKNTNSAQLKSWGDIFSPGRCTGLTNCEGVLMLVMLSVCFALSSAADKCFNVYVMPITEVSPLGMTPDEASSLVMCIFISLAVGRFVGYGLSNVAKPQVVLISQTIGCIVSLTALWASQLTSRVMMWTTMSMFGIFSGFSYAALLAVASCYMEMTAMVVAVADIGVAVGNYGSVWLGGILMDTEGPLSLIILLVGFYVVLNVIAVAFIICGERHDPDSTK